MHSTPAAARVKVDDEERGRGEASILPPLAVIIIRAQLLSRLGHG